LVDNWRAELTDGIDGWVESEQDASGCCIDVADVSGKRAADAEQSTRVEQRVDVDETAQSNGNTQLPSLLAVAVEDDAVAAQSARGRQLHLVTADCHRARVSV